jgi:hypothetical protein
MLDRTLARVLLSSLAFSAWFAALLFGVLGPAAHLFLAAALAVWPWRATLAVARRGDDRTTDAVDGPEQHDRSTDDP